jgi:DNA repair protein RadC
MDGLAGFNNYEVVEVLLTLARTRGDCKESAKQAIKRFKTVRGVLDASPKELQEIRDIGPVCAETIKMVRALALYYLNERVDEQKIVLSSSQRVVDCLRVEMRDLPSETFWAVYVDCQNCRIKNQELFRGTLTSSVVYPREVFREALQCGAASVVFAHNHPSGCVEPSEQDRQITRDLVLAASYMDVKVLDHIVIGTNEYYSFADHGLMQEYRRQALEFQESRRRLP